MVLTYCRFSKFINNFSPLDRMISAMASILAAARVPHDELRTALTSPRRSPLSRVAFDLAELEEVQLVKGVLAAGALE
jgi:hypothetical protein